MSEGKPLTPQADTPSDGPAATERSLTGEVRLDSFRGPLELLLHLIRTEEIDVTTLPIADIVRQYNEFLSQEPRIEPEAAGEHVVGVATLIHMKSRRLLPPDPEVAADTPISAEEQEQIDRAARVEALRQVAEHLQEREAVMELMYLRPQAAIAEYAGEEGIDADLFALLRAFREILRRVASEESAHIGRERITLAERIGWLMETLQRERHIQFRALFRDLVDRVACILTFLALLEVMRLRLVRAYQSHHQEDILIVLADEPPTTGADGERTDV